MVYSAHWGKPTYPMNMLQSERHSSTHSKASTPAPEQPKPGPRKKQRSLEEVNSEEEENVALMLASVPGRSAARSTPAPRAGSVIPAGRSQRSTRSAKKSQPLFLDSDDDEAGPTKNGALDEDASEDFGVAMDAISEGDEDEDEDSTTLPTRSSRSNNTQTRSRATPAPSQKLAVTKPKATAKAGFRSRKPPAVMDDDSDDGATFKGFVRTRSRR